MGVNVRVEKILFFEFYQLQQYINVHHSLFFGELGIQFICFKQQKENVQILFVLKKCFGRLFISMYKLCSYYPCEMIPLCFTHYFRPTLKKTFKPLQV